MREGERAGAAVFCLPIVPALAQRVEGCEGFGALPVNGQSNEREAGRQEVAGRLQGF